eukprot:1803484-Pyramimonas_sp.AAC.1
MNLEKIYSRVLGEKNYVPLCVGLAAGAIAGALLGYQVGKRTAGEDEEYDDPSSSNLREDDIEYKMVLCVRNDLKMGKGKIGAQCRRRSVVEVRVVDSPQSCNTGIIRGATRVQSACPHREMAGSWAGKGGSESGRRRQHAEFGSTGTQQSELLIHISLGVNHPEQCTFHPMFL